MIKFYGYKKCSTCRKAELFLISNSVEFEYIDITEHPPSKGQLKKVLTASKKTIKKLFNTSGQAYRQMGLKDRIDTLNDEEIFTMLAANGKLIKRPLLLENKVATIGFSEEEYIQAWT